MTGWRARFFKLAALLFPLMLLAAGEIVLWSMGYGFPTDFFIRSKFHREKVWIENQQFAWRFVPPELARSPLSQTIKPKKDGVVRIFILGESAAMGDPEPAFGPARILEILLSHRYPETEFEVINAAVTAINSHIIPRIAEDIAEWEGDYWIVYAGNNEVIGPYGPAAATGEEMPSVTMIRANAWLRQWRAGQLLASFQSGSRDLNWRGMEMFVGKEIAANDPRLETVYDRFGENLGSIIKTGLDSGAAVIVSSVASNLRDFSPSASDSSGAGVQGHQGQWKELLSAGSGLARAGRFGEAIGLLAQAAEIVPKSAEVQFQLGRCYLGLGQIEQAKTSFVRARDLDTLRFRADSQINSLIAEAATKSPEVSFLDAESIFFGAAESNIPGDDLFYEHVHFTFRGAYILARALAEKIETLMGRAGAERSGPWFTEEDCAARLGFTIFAQRETLRLVYRRLEAAPFNLQSVARERRERQAAQLRELNSRLTANKDENGINAHRLSVESAPSDWMLRDHLARALMAIGDAAEAIEHWEKAAEVAPQDPALLYRLAYAQMELNRGEEAWEVLDRVLRIRPAFPQAHSLRARIRLAAGDEQGAVAAFEQAVKIDPSLTETYLLWGQALEQHNRLAGAIQQFNHAIQINTNSAASHAAAARVLRRQGRRLEAARHFAELVRLEPTDAMHRFSLAKELLEIQRVDLAIQALREAIALAPNLAEAHYQLALALLRENRVSESIDPLKATTQLRPDFGPGWFNLGVALAKTGQFEEGILALGRALEIDPSNEQARVYITKMTTETKAANK